jgi:GDP-4-dehydro-6-deoxy-D-mannose reductase
VRAEATSPNRRLVVTGAAGFLGARVMAAARRAGFEALGIVRSCELGAVAAGAAVEVLDWADPVACRRLLERVAPAVIVHCAGHNGRFSGAPDKAVLHGANVGLTAALLSAVAALDPAPSAVALSSAAVYGPQPPVPTPESAPLAPHGEYAASKVAAEGLCRAAAGRGLRVVVGRPFNVIGPGEPPGSVSATLTAQALLAPRHGRAAVRLREIVSVRDFIDADDVADALVLLGSAGTPGAAYNICTGRGVSVAELVRRASAVWQRRLDLTVADAQTAGTVSIGDPGALLALGWRPRRTLDDSLAAIAAGHDHEPAVSHDAEPAAGS